MSDAMRSRTGARLHVGLRQAQHGEVVRGARNPRQQFLVRAAHIAPAFSVVERFGARQFAFNRSTRKLFCPVARARMATRSVAILASSLSGKWYIYVN